MDVQKKKKIKKTQIKENMITSRLTNVISVHRSFEYRGQNMQIYAGLLIKRAYFMSIQLFTSAVLT